LRTLGDVSTTEGDLDESIAADAVDALTADDTGDHAGPDTADLDALDESLVDSIAEYTGVEDVEDVEPATDDDDDGDAGFAADGDGDGDGDDDTEIDEIDDADIDDIDDIDEPADLDDINAQDDSDDSDDDSEPVELAAVASTGDDETTDDTTDEDSDQASIDDAAEAERSEDDSVDESGDEPGDEPGVSPNILEELRRADIDGPVVDAAPQDDTTAGRRRPRKPVDFDPAPVPVPLKVPRILGRKPRVRKVTRVVRHVDPWSVFKIALLANFVLYVIVLTAGVLLWNVAYATGTVENVERFFESFGWQSFEFNGGELYHAAWIAGLFAVLGLTGLWVLLATLFNLITDVVGGARFTVLEEEVVESRVSPMRRFVVRRPEPEIPAMLADSSGPLIREAVVDDTGGIER